MVFDVGVTFHPFDRIAVLIEFERFRPEGDVLIKFHVVPDPRGFADHDAGAVVDEEMRTDLGPGVEVGAGAFMRILGEHAGQQGDL